MTQRLSDMICARRTVHKFSDKVISEEVLFDILKKAGTAPFHANKEPWHMHYLASDTAKKQGEQAALSSYQRQSYWIEGGEEYQTRMTNKAHKMFIGNPVTLLVGRDVFDNEHEEMISLTSLGAFLQNLELIAWEVGIGMIWGSHVFLEDPEFLKDMDIPENEKLVAHVHLGYIHPDEHLVDKGRTPLTEWLTVS